MIFVDIKILHFALICNYNIYIYTCCSFCCQTCLLTMFLQSAVYKPRSRPEERLQAELRMVCCFNPMVFHSKVAVKMRPCVDSVSTRCRIQHVSHTQGRQFGRISCHRPADTKMQTSRGNSLTEFQTCLIVFLLLTHLRCTGWATLHRQVPVAFCSSREFLSVLPVMVFPLRGLNDLCSNKNVCVCMCISRCLCACLYLHVSLRCQGLSLSPPLPLQAHVKAPELLQEALVGTDVSMRPDGSHGLPQRQALHNHQEGQHQCRRAAHTHQTVDKHSTWHRDCLTSAPNMKKHSFVQLNTVQHGSAAVTCDVRRLASLSQCGSDESCRRVKVRTEDEVYGVVSLHPIIIHSHVSVETWASVDIETVLRYV